MKNQRYRRSTRRSAPVIATLEQSAFAAADTVANATLYAPPTTSVTSIQQRWRVRVRGLITTVKDGDSTDFRAYAIVRKLPNGYSAPSITVSSAVTTFADVDNVLAYGLYYGADTRDSIQWRWLKRTTDLIPGDSLILQLVGDSASTNRAASTVIEYDVTAM
jgi:hypothetical protein